MNCWWILVSLLALVLLSSSTDASLNKRLRRAAGLPGRPGLPGGSSDSESGSGAGRPGLPGRPGGSDDVDFYDDFTQEFHSCGPTLLKILDACTLVPNLGKELKKAGKHKNWMQTLLKISNDGHKDCAEALAVISAPK